MIWYIHVPALQKRGGQGKERKIRRKQVTSSKLDIWSCPACNMHDHALFSTMPLTGTGSGCCCSGQSQGCLRCMSSWTTNGIRCDPSPFPSLVCMCMVYCVCRWGTTWRGCRPSEDTTEMGTYDTWPPLMHHFELSLSLHPSISLVSPSPLHAPRPSPIPLLAV